MAPPGCEGHDATPEVIGSVGLYAIPNSTGGTLAAIRHRSDAPAAQRAAATTRRGETAEGTQRISDTGLAPTQDPAEQLGSRWETAGKVAATSALWVTVFLLQLSFAVELLAIFQNNLGCIDLLVYRASGRAVLSDSSLYAPDFAQMNHSPNGLPFTYPPFAALIFVPFAVMPLVAAKTVMVALNLAACAILFLAVVVSVRGGWGRLGDWRRWAASARPTTRIVLFVSAVSFVMSEPVQTNFSYGQINLILAAAVAVDVLVPSVRWPRGLLVGLAVAVKLTPVLFIGYFLLTRQWRAAVVSSVTAMLATLASWISLPANSVQYFRSLPALQTRVGDLELASNQSLWGVIVRVAGLDSVRGQLWATATMLLLTIAAVAIAVNYRRGDACAAMLAAALAGVLCSPVSWNHHWVWLSAAATYFLIRWTRTRAASDLLIGATVAVITVVAPWTFLPSYDERERLWNPLQHLAGSAWALASVLILFAFASTALHRAPRVVLG